MQIDDSLSRKSLRATDATPFLWPRLGLPVLVLVAHLTMLPGTVGAESFFWSDGLPPVGGKYVSPLDEVVGYQVSGAQLKNASFSVFTVSVSPPPPGTNALQSLGCQVALQLSTNGGVSFFNVNATATVTVRLTQTNAFGVRRWFGAELLQLDISGGSLPAGLKIRESPTLASPGATTIRGASGGYRIESTFDVFTEVSLNGGLAWQPATNTLRLALTTVTPPPFIEFGAAWKYSDDGSDLSVFWREMAFQDGTWASGPAQLGYGDGDESTTNSFGTNANNKFITTFYRRTFWVEDAAIYTNLLVKLLRDDGGVVYLNGTEVFRSNMPTGEISYLTFAASGVPAKDETTNYYQRAINPVLLVNGTNLVAVEIHQVTNDSSDISFDLALIGNFIPVPPMVSIINPTNGATRAAINLTITAAAADSDGTVVKVEFFEGGNKLGEVTNAPYSLIWSNVAPGTYTLTAVARDSSSLTATSAPVTVTVVAPPPSLIPMGAVWNYLADGSNQGTNWIAPMFDDSSWANGPAQLGFGETDEATRIGDMTNGFITFYFRHTFYVQNPATYSNLVVRLLRDDGGIVYLNGAEVFRSNMTNGLVNYLTRALAAVEAAGFYATNVPVSLLRTGTNVMAVEIHQINDTSSDLSFDLELLPNIPPTPPTIVITIPSDNDVFVAPTNVDITTVATDFDGPIARVDFYVDGARYSEDTTEPYTCVATNPAIGTHTLRAVATDASGLSATSPPVHITVIGGPVYTTLSATGSVWRFLDNSVDQLTAWRAPDFDDKSWRVGTAKFGTNDPSMTLIQLTRTVYFRRAFLATNVASYTNLAFRVLRDDGVVVYLNGSDIFRMNMTNGPVNFLTPASVPVGGTDETYYFPTNISPAGLVEGTNVLAVELHQTAGTTDAGFDLGLSAIAPPGTNRPRPTLDIMWAGSEIVIAWTLAGFILQEADDVAGPYRDVLPLVTTSPFRKVSPAGRRFYKLRLGP